ncbi:hypothetical protein [Halobacteriovorax sp. YZS-1-1]|uniref:hypothetical protein n=1 Tax=unclassified Halobacteriovorax TaxID=2639665 RepID=UPI00399A2A2F
MNLEMGKIFAGYLYGLFVFLQSFLCYLVWNDYFIKKYGPKVANAFDGAIIQSLGVVPIAMSLIFFFVLGSQSKIRKRISSDKFIKTHDKLNCEEIARFEVVAMWTNAWALASTITMLGVLGVITHGISSTQFYFSYGSSLALMLIMFPRPKALRMPLGDNVTQFNPDNCIELYSKDEVYDNNDKDKKMSA